MTSAQADLTEFWLVWPGTTPWHSVLSWSHHCYSSREVSAPSSVVSNSGVKATGTVLLLAGWQPEGFTLQWTHQPHTRGSGKLHIPGEGKVLASWNSLIICPTLSLNPWSSSQYGKPGFLEDTDTYAIEDYIGPDSPGFFYIVKLDPSYLYEPANRWESLDSYNKTRTWWKTWRSWMMQWNMVSKWATVCFKW